MTHPAPSPIDHGPGVAEALAAGEAVVALESTIFSELGLPAPHNRDALTRCFEAVRGGGALPALTAVLAGSPTIGVPESAVDTICGPARKVAARDLGVAAAQAWPYGATTVSASVRLAAAAGCRVFATGGIGGVHHDAATTGDISADLDALAEHRVITVSAGAKIFLDLPRTLEYLETRSVPVLGWRCDEFPAFHVPSSGIALDHRVDTAAEVAEAARRHWALGGGGLLVVAPVPEADGLELDDMLDLSRRADALAVEEGVTGPAVTPAVLGHLAGLSGGRVIAANLALAENNAAIAARIAAALATA
ncbi:MAG: pseudouridine-5'-phosphate glycosidase [Actinomycetota bacterium]